MSSTGLLSHGSIALSSASDRELSFNSARNGAKRPAVNFPATCNRQNFTDGFIAGWQSLVDPEMAMPEIPIRPTPLKISAYFQGLLRGIEAAKKHNASLSMQLAESCE